MTKMNNVQKRQCYADSENKVVETEQHPRCQAVFKNDDDLPKCVYFASRAIMLLLSFIPITLDKDK